ncbi:MAG TPA: cell division protein ZapE [Caulobacteraceae bacterium]|nr:cell division protein ZapE [Caulobacteraceae bacterium]
MTSRLREFYQERLATGALKPDPGQRAAVEALARLEIELAQRRRWRGRAPPRGVYLFGPVGRGKSLLLDLFFTVARVAPRRRVHFHEFMAQVHARLNLWRRGDAAARRAAFGRVRAVDPIAPLARLIASEARLLAFDEFEVTDIADAMILGRLFEALLSQGVVIVATSNRAPAELYAGGLNRQLFLPFIPLIENRLEVVEVTGAADHRLDRLRASGSWFSPIDPDNERSFDELWRAFVGSEGETGVTLQVLGRAQHWPHAAGAMLRADFESLCGRALGPADYLALAERFDTVFVEGLTQLPPERREAARRFAILVDTLYEARARLVVLAACEPAQLYPAGARAFEFQRAVSRLEEMRSAHWLERRAA